MSEVDLSELLAPPKTIAVVGLSDKPDRPSYQVANYLREQGFTIIPVNPQLVEWNGLTAYPSLSALPAQQAIDVVDIFRRSEAVPAIVAEVLHTNRQPLIWMQEGVVSEPAKQLAETHGLTVIMDRCMMKEHRRLLSNH